MWEHHKLLVYQKAVEAFALADGIAERIPPRRADLREQLHGAAASVVLNLAEGASEMRPGEKARFYRMSRRSAAECASILELVSVVSPQIDTKAAAHRFEEVSALVTRLIASLDR